jgi:protocatechuate 3,4-dioxygenase beta subunit
VLSVEIFLEGKRRSRRLIVERLLIESEVDMDKASQRENRRSFLKRASIFAVALPAGIFLGCARPAQTQPSRVAQSETKWRIGGYCEGCEAIYGGMPSQLNWESRIAPATEPGEPFEASGVIYQPDGKTPAPGVILYAYHTNAKGIYPPAPDATGDARRHGRLRGWIKTNAKGEYKFHTIRPASYPGRNIPAHIHLIVKEPDKNEYYIDDFEFDDDPMLTPQERARRRNGGGSGIVRLNKNSDGVWLARRDIVLGLHVPDYS